MTTLFYLSAAVIAFFFVSKSADIFVKNCVIIARHFGVSPVLIGVVLVSIATSSPEIVVTGLASFLGKSDVVVGNASGSIAANSCIALALIFLLTRGSYYSEKKGDKKVDTKFNLLNLVFLIPGTVVVFFLTKNGINRIEGFFLILIVALYFYFNTVLGISHGIPKVREEKIGRVFLNFFLSILLLFVSSRAGLWAAVNFAKNIGVSQFLISVLLIAFGTSIPEIATSISATRQGEVGLAISELIGSQALNLFLLFGVASLVKPVFCPKPNFVFGWILFILSITFLFIFWKKPKNVLKAFILFVVYGVYIYTIFSIMK